jgi:OmcA/MtrC family decaheme c-type cytochrome
MVKLGYAYSGAKDVIQVRSKSPTRGFVVGTGALHARRGIIDTEKCLGCHVGSLYQHGGNRVDNVDLCVTCHNEASSEQSVRVGDGVDASVAYDGKSGQTYGFKSLLHAIHSTDRDDGPVTMVYRKYGIYVWAGKDTVIPNWPGTGSQTVYGSTPSGTNPDGTTRTHYLHVPTYPRNLKDCAACHTAGSYVVADQATAMATTVNAGTAPWSNQLDDVLISANTATCMSCHQGAAQRAHAYQNSWAPQVFIEGRKTIMDAAN